MFTFEHAEELVTLTPAAIVWEADPETFQFIYVSQAAEQLLGYSTDDWLSRPSFWVDLIHPEDRHAAVAACRRAVALCEDHEFEYRMIAADGRTIWIRDIVRVVCDCSGKPTALRGAIVDVSDRRRAERARGPVCGDDAATRRETDARLAGAIAHDINNVLFTIAGTAGLALGAPRVPETREALEAIERAASVGAALAARLLTLDGSGDTQAIVDVLATIARLEGWLRELLGPAVTVELVLHRDNALVQLQKGQLEQILLNLAINSREAMLSGGRFRITTWCDRRDDTRNPQNGTLVMEISDTGCGIEPDLLDRIFDSHVTTKSQSQGIGLATVANIVRHANGTIAVRSRVGAGTSFIIKLPLA